MQPSCLLDTDILSEVFKGRDATVVARAVAYQAEYGRLSTSAVTVMEVVKGMRRLQREQALIRLLAAMEACEVLTFEAHCAKIAGSIYGDLERTGQPIGRADVMIASIAVANDRTLVTGNLRHYRRIVELGYELHLDNWRETAARP